MGLRVAALVHERLDRTPAVAAAVEPPAAAVLAELAAAPPKEHP